MGKFEKRKYEGHHKDKGHFRHNKRPRDSFSTQGPRLTEVDVGVTEYVSDYPGFSGIIKQRFSDFVVNEIDLDDKVVHLTELNPVILDEAPEPAEIATLDDFTDAICKEDWDALKQLADTKKGCVDIDVSEKSKDERKQIHEAIKKIYKNEFTANTKEADGRKVISVIFQKDQRRGYFTKVNRYIHFTMYKENMDTMDAVNVLAQKLGVRPGHIAYAGTKDKRAKTSQRLSMRNTKPSQIFKASKSVRGINVGDFKFSDQPLKLGSLKGNRFQIVLRNVCASDEDIEKSMKSLQEKGFLNYFGLQRFGTQSIPTYEIGKALVSGKWEEAVDLILKPRDGDFPNLINARKVWQETKNAGEAFKQLRGRMGAEGFLLKGLMNNHKNDLVNALEAIPRNTRLLYMHSYQSYIWNNVLSRRIKELGFKPVVGDLVLAEGAKLDEVLDDSVLEEPADGPSESTSSANEPSKLPAVKVLTADDLSKYTIHDIVLSIPGFNVKYPENECLEWFKEMLAKDGLTLESLKQSEKKYSLGGAYRKISMLPSHVSWKITQYDDATLPLVASDVELIEKKEIPLCKEGKLKAVVMDFRLPSSVYATMALREVLKIDTSSHHQTTLNPTAPVVEKSSEESMVKSEEETSVPVQDDGQKMVE